MNAELDNSSWIVDSGSTDHVTHHGEWFSSFEWFKTPAEIHVGNKSTMAALGKGTIKFEALVNEKWLSCHMENVLYAPMFVKICFQ